MRIIYHRNSTVKRWRIDFYPDEKIADVTFVSRQLGDTEPENPNFQKIRRAIDKYCSDYNLQASWCL